jgi:hypothetical protein
VHEGRADVGRREEHTAVLLMNETLIRVAPCISLAETRLLNLHRKERQRIHASPAGEIVNDVTH